MKYRFFPLFCAFGLMIASITPGTLYSAPKKGPRMAAGQQTRQKPAKPKPANQRPHQKKQPQFPHAKKPAHQQPQPETWRSKIKRYAVYASLAGAAGGYLFLEVRSRMLENPVEIRRFERAQNHFYAHKDRLRRDWNRLNGYAHGPYPYEQAINQTQNHSNIFDNLFETFFRQQYRELENDYDIARIERIYNRWTNYLFGSEPARYTAEPQENQQPRNNPFEEFRQRPENNRENPFHQQEVPPRAPEPQEADPYAVLGIDRNSSRAQIIRAYRDQALLFHPDRYEANQDQLRAQGIQTREHAEQRMADINHARDVLIG